jgi:hypothetical protein
MKAVTDQVDSNQRKSLNTIYELNKETLTKGLFSSNAARTLLLVTDSGTISIVPRQCNALEGEILCVV